MSFTLRMPAQVYCGNDGQEKLLAFAAPYRKVCVFTDAAVARTLGAQKMLSALRDAGKELTVLDDLKPEPVCDDAQETVDVFRKSGAELIVAIGGGSVMDVAKLASISATDAITVRSLLENPLLGSKTVPTVMIPTTAGTGAEATPNSIVTVPEKQLKAGIVNPEMIADLVILDGDMTAELPMAVAASTGADALCHAIECYTSNKATPFSNLFALEALKLIFTHMETVCLQPDAKEAKNAMLLAAFYGGVAITASGTTAVHALSYPLGGRYHIPHGVANAIMLMPVMRFNAPACLPVFAAVLNAVDPAPELSDIAKAERLLNRMQEMLAKLGIPSSLAPYGVTAADLDALVEAGMAVTRLLNNNPRPVTAADARRMYASVL
ncbi:MAG: iron-containing alcohol dehydrogenase [Eubacteriales bacterium]|nr:iron-containing alcohol dehydrogenase [Eubacteriales bacterium]